jgi:cyanophycin synthetase
VAYEEEDVGRAALEAARSLCLAGLNDQEIDVPAMIDHLRLVADRVCLGPSTRAIVRAAQARGIPVRRLNLGSFVQLGHGSQQRRVRTAETDATGAVSEVIASDKELTKQLLAAVGVPVPEGRPADSAADAWAAAEEIGVPVVVKPRDGNHGRGVFTALTTREEVEAAYTHASEEGDGVLVERFALGAEHRLLVVNGKFVAGVRGDPASVVGDGMSTIRELIASQLNSDPRRGETDDCPLAPVTIDSVARLLLSQRGYTADSVPPEGERVLIQYNGNLAIDVTDEVHPEVAARLVDAARVVGLDVAGIDVVAQDISRPLEEQDGVVVEVNAGPGLHMHLYPSVGKPRPVGDAIVAGLYPTDRAGRIPLVGVLGTHASQQVARAVAEVLYAGGAAVGLSCTDGIFIGPRRLTKAPAHERRAAELLLANNRVESAVIGVTPEAILETGLAIDVCDIAVVGDRLTDEALATSARTLIESVPREGSVIVHAGDEAALRLRSHAQGDVVLVAMEPSQPEVATHLSRGGRAVIVRHGQIIALHAGEETFLASVTRLPESTLANLGMSPAVLVSAAAAGWVIGRSPRLIRAGLESFVRASMTHYDHEPITAPTSEAAAADVSLGEKDPKAA